MDRDIRYSDRYRSTEARNDMRSTRLGRDAVVRQRVTPPAPDAVRLRGLLGGRLTALREHRLLQHEEDYLLWPFREHCKVVRDDDGVAEWMASHPQGVLGDWGWLYEDGEPPPHPDIAMGDYHGEFIGTWVAAAIVAAVNAGDDQLRAKVDRVVREWLATQEADGYLGTYDAVNRWKSWDVWIQAHALVGLLTYHDLTGDAGALTAATRVADRVLQDFGPGRRSLTSTGSSGGMASSAILEPLIRLSRLTGTERYLEVARWLVDVDWEQPGGPAIISSLRAGRSVASIADGKAAEMLIDLAGMVELYRSTGENRYLDAVLTAWEDVRRRHLYITGSASAGELFHPSFELPNDGSRIGETCVTMCWIYLSLSLGWLTAEGRFLDAVEQALYNHLLGAQSPDGRGWAYYVGLRDAKRYGWHTDPECCPTRGTRALCLTPLAVVGIDDEGLVVHLYEDSEAHLRLATGESVALSLATRYPFDGAVRVELQPDRAHTFAVRLRLPAWCHEWSISVAGLTPPTEVDGRGYVVVRREWRPDDVIEIDFAMPVRAVLDTLGNRGRVALTRGPLVYAVDASYLPEGYALDDVTLSIDPRDPTKGVELVDAEGSVHLLAPWAWTVPDGSPMWGAGRYHYVEGRGQTEHHSVRLVPFFEAGNRDPNCYLDGLRGPFDPAQLWQQQPPTYQVWIPFVRG